MLTWFYVAGPIPTVIIQDYLRWVRGGYVLVLRVDALPKLG